MSGTMVNWLVQPFSSGAVTNKNAYEHECHVANRAACKRARFVLSILELPRQSLIYSLKVRSSNHSCVLSMNKHVDMPTLEINWMDIPSSVTLERVRKILSIAGMLPMHKYQTVEEGLVIMAGDAETCAAEFMDQKNSIIYTLRHEWEAVRMERYQQQRERMGLERLQPGQRRSHWDEDMRQAYTRTVGIQEYLKEREAERLENLAKEIEFNEKAIGQIVERRKALLDEKPNRLLLLYKDCSLTRDLVAMMTVSMAKEYPSMTLTDQMNGLQWTMKGSIISNPVAMKRYTDDILFIFCGFNKKLDPVLEQIPGLKDLLLDDAAIEDAAFRFATGSTYIQHCYGCRPAMEYAFFSDLNGDSIERPALFTLAQIIIYARMEADEYETFQATEGYTQMINIWGLMTNNRMHNSFMAPTWRGFDLITFIQHVQDSLQDARIIRSPQNLKMFFL